MLELSVYDEIPHLLTPVVTDPKKVPAALKYLLKEMEKLEAQVKYMLANPLPACETKIEGNVATITGGWHEAFIDALVEVGLEGVERIVVRVPQRVRRGFAMQKIEETHYSNY